MSYGMTAAVLIRLDARMGSWVPLSELSQHLAVPEATLQMHCARLQREQLLSVQREGRDGPITHARIDRADMSAHVHPAGDQHP